MQLLDSSMGAVLATVPDCHLRSRSGSELNHSQIGRPGCLYRCTVNSGMLQWESPKSSELAGLSEGRPPGPSVDLYNVLVFAV